MLAFVARSGFLSRSLCALVALVTGLVVIARPAAAQIGSERYASIVIDAASGTVLSAVNPDDYRFPASLTKMMTLYLLFEAVRDRRIGLNQYVPVSPSAASMSPTKLGLVPGSLITVEQAVLGLVTKSANDAAAALGELLGGDEDRFAQMMTLRARALGMSRTTFRNASGLPDWNQVTTARDMAILARRLIQDFPGYYHYFSTASFVYAGRTIYSHQRLLQSYPGADGLKTGYTDASGFNVVTSAVRSDTRLIGVVLGAANGGERDLHMASLLDQGFERMGVAPPVYARREPAYREPAYRVPSFIGSAHAGTMVAAQRPVAPGRAGRPVVIRPAAERAAPRRMPEAQSRRAQIERPPFERPVARSVVARAPARVQVREPAIIRPASASTRTAHQNGGGRYPG